MTEHDGPCGELGTCAVGAGNFSAPPDVREVGAPRVVLDQRDRRGVLLFTGPGPPGLAGHAEVAGGA